MGDLALAYDADSGLFDLALVGGDLASDDGLATAIAVSLFSDARAADDDEVPAGADRRGWWGDAGATVVGDRIGSRLWLLTRAKLTSDVALRARDIARAALDWLLEDGIAAQVDVSAEIVPATRARPTGGLRLIVTLSRPGGAGEARYDFTWSATARSLNAS